MIFPIPSNVMAFLNRILIEKSIEKSIKRVTLVCNSSSYLSHLNKLIDVKM